jgi:hypothetical protein
MTLRAPLFVAALTVVAAGCQDPYAAERRSEDPPRAPESQPAQRPRSDERPPPTNERDTAPDVGLDAQRTPQAAMGAFCAQWANWSWRTIGRQQRRLARLAAGPLAGQLAAEAKLRAQDQALRRDRLGVRGRVVAIDIKRGTSTRDAVCVTWERAQANGRADLEGARHRVYLATVALTRNGWAVRQWEPQP